MKGGFPRVVLQSVKGQTVLSAISGLFSFFWRALVGFDLRGAPYLISNPRLSLAFMRERGRLLRGNVLAPGVSASFLLLQKYSHTLHLCSIYLLGQQI